MRLLIALLATAAALAQQRNTTAGNPNYWRGDQVGGKPLCSATVTTDCVQTRDASGNATIGTTVLVSTSVCDGATDSRVALQSILTANAGKHIVLPDGATCLLTPVADKSKFLSLSAGTRLSGRATLKVADGSAPYDKVLYSTSCAGCSVSGLTVDANVAGNAAANEAELIAHPRIDIFLLGDDVRVSGVTVKNSTGVNSVVITGARASVEGSTFTAMGDDPNHVVHDTSVVYVTSTQASIARNHFTAASLGAPGAYTAIETHGSDIAVTANTILNFVNGMNISGSALSDSIGNTVTGNSISGALYGISLWSAQTGAHTTGYGINGLTISGNSIRINQVAYVGLTIYGAVTNTYGIDIDPNANLPVANISISNNVIVFDPEPSSRTGNTSSFGIGWYSVPGQTAENISVQNNIIDHSPLAAIRFSTGGIKGLNISGNTIRNAGQSLDGAVTQAYKTPIFIATVTGATQGTVSRNTIIDDFATSRIVNAFFLAGANVANDLSMIDNTVSLLGSTTTAWATYFSQADDYLIPLVRMVAFAKPWTTPIKKMRNGSQVYDATTATAYTLWADGIAWGVSQRIGSGGIGLKEAMHLGYYNATASGTAVNYYLSDTTQTGGIEHVLQNTSPLITDTHLKTWINGVGLVDGIRSTPYGVQLPGRAGPTCAAAYAGIINYSGHTADVKDTVTICAADASNVWAWRAIY